MEDSLSPRALVTVMTLSKFGTVTVDVFEMDYYARPLWASGDDVYSCQRVNKDGRISEMLRLMPVDVATWLHRQGAWNTTEET